MTAYALAQASGGRISTSTAYRLVKKRGRLENYDAEMLEALADVFGVAIGELFERTTAPPRAAQPQRRARR